MSGIPFDDYYYMKFEDSPVDNHNDSTTTTTTTTTTTASEKLILSIYGRKPLHDDMRSELSQLLESKMIDITATEVATSLR